jgi:hypothetical protein
MSVINNSPKQNPDAMLIAGLQKRTPNLALIVSSQPQTLAQLVATLQGRADSAAAVAAAKAKYQTAVKAEKANRAATAVYVHDVRQSVKAMFSNSPEILADFGMVPDKVRTPLTAAEKVLAAAKAKATRAARHTLGKTQKASISGSLTGAVTVQLDATTTVAAGSNGSGTGSTPAHS